MSKDSPFAFPSFRNLLIARSLLTLAMQSQGVALGWQVYDLSRKHYSVEQSALIVGLVGLSQFLAQFLLILPGGAAVDRNDRKKIVLLAVCGYATAALGLTLAAIGVVFQPQLEQGLLWVFVGLASVFGASRAFLAPALQALAPQLVPREVLPRAVAFSSLAMQFGAVSGPLLGGALAAISPILAYAVCAGLLISGGVIVLGFVTSPGPPPAPEVGRIEMIREGIAYIAANPVVLGAMSLDLFAVLLGGATALLPVYARDILHVGSHGYGMLRAATWIGAAVMTVYLARAPITRHAGLWIFSGVAVYGVATIVFSQSAIFGVSVAALAILGAGDAISVNVRQSLVQIRTPDAMRGRVGSVSSLFIGASNELGEFESGVTARLMGAVGACLFGGVGSLAIVGLWAKIFPSLRTADALLEPAKPAVIDEDASEAEIA